MTKPILSNLAKKVDELSEEFVKKNSIYVSVPHSVQIATGSEFKMYYRNVISMNGNLFWLGYLSSITTRYYDDYITIAPAAAGTYTLPWKVFDDQGNLIKDGNLQVIAFDAVPTGTTTVLVIGDSTVDAGVMTNKVHELYASAGAAIKLLGTRGNGDHEGRGGWTAKMYCTVATSGGIANPFYNNGFDFAYYMANHNFTDLQAVVIQLGINDIFPYNETGWRNYSSTETLGYFNEIINSIHAYDSTIKVIINLPTTPNSNGMSFTESYGTTQIEWVYRRNIIRFAEELIMRYGNKPNIVISASNCVLDTNTQIRDGVHPTEGGYNALGQRLYEVLVAAVAGVSGVVPDEPSEPSEPDEPDVTSLLNFETRERVMHVNTVNAADAHDLSESKCHATNTAGARGLGIDNSIAEHTVTSDSEMSIKLITGKSGMGIEYPVPSLEAGKTYALKYTCDKANMRVYLMKYDASTTAYVSNELLSSVAGTHEKTITPDAAYIYTILFTGQAGDTVFTWSDVTLTEN